MRHRDWIFTRRCCLTTAQQLASVLAFVVGATEILAETTDFQLHVAAAFFALNDRAVIALQTELALLDDITIAFRVIAADMQFAVFIDDISRHRAAAFGAAFFRTQLDDFGFFVFGRHHFISGNQIDGFLAALFRRQIKTGAAEEHPGRRGANRHRPTAIWTFDIGFHRLRPAHAAFFIFGGLQLGDKVLVELIQRLFPVGIAFGDFIELLFHLGGEIEIEQIGE